MFCFVWEEWCLWILGFSRHLVEFPGSEQGTEQAPVVDGRKREKDMLSKVEEGQSREDILEAKGSCDNKNGTFPSQYSIVLGVI